MSGNIVTLPRLSGSGVGGLGSVLLARPTNCVKLISFTVDLWLTRYHASADVNGSSHDLWHEQRSDLWHEQRGAVSLGRSLLGWFGGLCQVVRGVDDRYV